MRQVHNIALFCFVVYLFHILRNLTPIYLIFLLTCLLALGILLIKNCKFLKFNNTLFLFFSAWFFSSLTTLIQSGEYGDSIAGLIRFWASFPLAIIGSVLATESSKRPMKILVVFFLLAALSFPFQQIFGSIHWFADSSERAGGSRFASLAGSLTAYGVGVGVPALAALFYFRRSLGLALFVALMIGAFFSLQKAALVNILLALITAWWLKCFPTKALFFSMPALALLIIGTYLSKGFESSLMETAFRSAKGVLNSSYELSHDVSFWESVVDRLTALPLETIQFFGVNALVLGVGVFGGAGVLGYPDLPMAHNGIIELIAIFGFFFGGAIISYMLYRFFKALLFFIRRDYAANTEQGFLSASYIIWFLNYVFSGGGIFHPIGAAVFWFLVFRLRHIEKSDRHQKVLHKHTEIRSELGVVQQFSQH